MARCLLYTLLLVVTATYSYAQQDSAFQSKFDDTLQMQEFVISAKTAIKISGDTTSYRVDSFYRDPLATTEDVLKRLPGVEVARDGSISIDGKPVNKIFINGKEYFGDELRSITQNLPAEVLEKIQVADWHDEEAQFSGIKKEGDEKVINLQFKKEYNDGIYGRVGAGYGTDDLYEGGLFGNYIRSEGVNITAIMNAGNTGVSDIANSSGGNVNNSPLGRSGVREEQKGVLNFSVDKEGKLKLNGSYRVTNSDNYLTRNTFTTTFLQDDSTLLQQQDNENNTNAYAHRLSLRSKYMFSEKTHLRTTLSLNYDKSQRNSMGDDITYQDARSNIDYNRHTETSSKNENYGLRLSNVLFKAFEKKGRTLIVSYDINYRSALSNGDNENYNTYYTPYSENEVFNRSVNTGNDLNSNISVRYTEPIGKKSNLSVKYENRYATNENDRTVEVADDGIYMTDTNQSSVFVNTNTNHNAGLTYQYQMEKLTTGIGIDVEPYDIRSERSGSNSSNVQQKGVNYFPELYLRYNLKANTSLYLRYNGSVNPPNANQLQSIPDYTDSLNIFIGNPTLTPELNNNVSFRFNINDHKKGRRFYAHIGGRWVNNKIINKTDISSSRRVTTLINADGNYALSASTSYTESILNKRLRTTISVSGSVNNNIVVTNGLLQNIPNKRVRPAFSIKYFSDKWYEGTIDYKYNWNEVVSSLNTKNVIQTHDLTHEGTFILPKGIRLSYNLVYMNNTGITQAFQRNFFLINASIDKTFEKPKGLYIRLRCFDFLNQYPTVQRNVGDNYYEDVSVNRIGSYYMLSVLYKFTYFKKK